MTKYTDWLESSRECLDIANYCFRRGFYGKALFHLQQANEHTSKSVLSVIGILEDSDNPTPEEYKFLLQFCGLYRIPAKDFGHEFTEKLLSVMEKFAETLYIYDEIHLKEARNGIATINEVTFDANSNESEIIRILDNSVGMLDAIERFSTELQVHAVVRNCYLLGPLGWISKIMDWTVSSRYPIDLDESHTYVKNYNKISRIVERIGGMVMPAIEGEAGDVIGNINKLLSPSK